MTLRRSSVAALLTVLAASSAACMPVGGPVVAPGAARGPLLVIAVTNESGEPQNIEYEHVAEASSGGGGFEASCGNSVMELGEVTGAYLLMVDDQEVASGRVPSGADPTVFLLFQIQIAEDGSATAAGPVLVERPPPVRPPAPCD